jgi:hypothetical protein
MGRLERHLNKELIEKTLALGLQSHAHSIGRLRPVVAFIAEQTLDRWPDPIHAAYLRAKRKRKTKSPSNSMLRQLAREGV